MPKIPKMSDLKSSMPGLLDKFKNMLDSISGPGTSTLSQEALAKETDPFKVKIIEVELLINQLHDIQVLENRTLHSLRNSYKDLQKILSEQQNKDHVSEVVEKPEDEKTLKTPKDISQSIDHEE